MSDQNFTVRPSSLDQTIKVIVESIDKGYELQELDENQIDTKTKLDFNDCLILKPFYQREYRSSIEDESSLIESILVGIPIPPVFLCSTRYKGVQVLDVVDGQHRLFAFYRFRKNYFKLTGLPLLPGLDNKNFDDLDFTFQEQFISHKLPAFVFRDFPGKEFELEVFNRYNKGTKTLTQQEIRNAVYSSPYNEFVNGFVKALYFVDEVDEKSQKLALIYNITKDRYLKKKVHEGIFSILYVLENGINEDFKDSTTYANEYMKSKTELSSKETEEYVNSELENTKKVFAEFNEWLLKCTSITKYPISKEIYGISSKSYKFQTSMALIIPALYKKVYIDNVVEFNTFEDTIKAIQNALKNSFLEDPRYIASSTNSKEIKKMVDGFAAKAL